MSLFTGLNVIDLITIYLVLTSNSGHLLRIHAVTRHLNLSRKSSSAHAPMRSRSYYHRIGRTGQDSCAENPRTKLGPVEKRLYNDKTGPVIWYELQQRKSTRIFHFRNLTNLSSWLPRTGQT